MKVIGCLMFILVAQVCVCPASYSQELGRGYDWEIQIQTEPLTNYLTYSGTSLKPITKAAVSYKDAAKKSVTRYEDLWYRACDAVGSKRYHEFKVPAAEGVAIRVTHKNGSADSSETCAAANAIVRLLLDAYMNSDSVISVIVPQRSFNEIVNDLHRENFNTAVTRPDEPEYSSIVLHLQSDPPGEKQTMNFVGKTTD